MQISSDIGQDSYEVPLHHRFEQQVRQFSERTALVCGDSRITYLELNTRANQMAHRLRMMKVGPESLVGLSLNRDIELIVAILAVLKAGGAYVPLDPSYPKDRLMMMLSDCQPAVLITEHALLETMNVGDVPVLCVDQDPEIAKQSIDNPSHSVALNNLAYIIYTSGSTGKPKGCLTEHGNVMRLWAESQKIYGFNEADIWTLFHSYAFDFSVWEIWGALLHGGTLLIVPYTVSRSPDDFYDLLCRENVTVLNQTPSAFYQLMRIDLEKNLSLKLRYLILGGEALNFQALKPWVARHGVSYPQIINGYGPTETTIFATFKFVEAKDVEHAGISNLGQVIPHLSVQLVDSDLKPVAAGEGGEILIGGTGVSRGYLHRADLTASRFIHGRFYRTGDLARTLPDGQLEYLGRIDSQVKIRGFRIELGEIDTVLRSHPAVCEAAVAVREDEPGECYLAAYLVPEAGVDFTFGEIRKYLAAALPEYMVPATIMEIDVLPLTPNGKLDRKALPKPQQKRPELDQPYLAPRTEMEKLLAASWCSLLKIDKAGVDDNFFALGGNSILCVQLIERLQRDHQLELPIVKLFEHPTIFALAKSFEKIKADPQLTVSAMSDDNDARKVAIIGMAARFPGANNLTELWKNLCEGLETTSFFSDAELDRSVSAEVRNRPNYVKARGILEDVSQFDAAFFGINPNEAELMDPQHRLFLENAWQALENAGYAPNSPAALSAGWIGVYGGVFNNSYYAQNVIIRRDLIKRTGDFQTMTANEKDYVATRVSHKLNLKGPSVSIHTACSTSLVAISHAYHALISQQCDLALAGGASVTVPQKVGHEYLEGAMLSRDGHTRPFDEQAQGTVFSDGVGVVVLKRLQAAMRDGDTIYGVILGAAINNDGENKMSFTAPSVEGQASVIARAQAVAGIHPESISYVEAHGTATPMGDPIEVEALHQAFKIHTDKKQFCVLGSVKGNFGHTTIAAGVAGVIKTLLSLTNQQIPPTVNFQKPNPNIDFANSPFKVSNQLMAWPKGDTPRRAGVSSFGVGGTNAHVIIEEAPAQSLSSPSRSQQLLMLSAKSENALNTMTQNLVDYLETHQQANLADIAFTLQTGRQSFALRRWLICDSVEQAIVRLKQLDPSYSATSIVKIRQSDVILQFPDLGSQSISEELKKLGGLWQEGATIDWQHFYEHENRHRIPLPGYPFERKKFWCRDRRDRIRVAEKTGEVVMETRKTRLITVLREILEDTAGIEVSEFDNATTFFEMGMDSLLLTQVVTALMGKFNINITFRQLLEEFSNLDQLADYMDAQLPADVMSATPVIPVAPAAVMATPVMASDAPHYQLINQQLQLMSLQLELLRGSEMSAPPMIAVAPVSRVTSEVPATSVETATPPKAFGAMARISTSKCDKKMSAEQEKALNQLIATYCKKTALSKKLAQENRAVLADPRIVSGFRPEVKELTYQIHTVKSSGSKLWDVDGNEYVDMSCGFGTNFFGNVPEFIKTAIKDQLDQGMEIGPSLPICGDVARLVCEFTRSERAALCSTGSEAVLAAMRLARTVTGRKILVSFTNDYHGVFDEVVVRGNKKLRTTPAAPGIMASCVENILVLDYGTPESLQIIRERAHEIAGIMVEPVQSRNPDLQPREYLHEMRKLTEEHNICLIFDEVITGFRVAPGGAQEYFDVIADLGTYGKVIGGGLPMGVVAGKKKWMDALDGGDWQFGDDSAPTVGVTYFAGTYVRHPLALAAAKAVLEYLKTVPNLQRELAEKTTQLVNELNSWCQQVGAPIHIAHFSSMYRLNYTQDLPYGDLLYVYMRERGVHIWDQRPCFMTAAHSAEDISLIINAFKASVTAMQTNGFMPAKVSSEMMATPPLAGAKLGRDPEGNPAWYVPDPNNPGKFLMVGG